MELKKVTLNTGAKMPMLGFGTFAGNAKDDVSTAIDKGYRLFDCAYAYKNEGDVGDAIQEKIKEEKIRREDIFVTSKLWLTHFRRVSECLKKSLKLLQLDYVDLYLMHLPCGLQYQSEELSPFDENNKVMFDEGIHYTEVWKEMEELQKAGLTKAIGISNFNEYQINKLLEKSTISPAVHQYEVHPYLSQENLFQFCKSKGIITTGFSPFAGPGRFWGKPEEPNLFTEPKLERIAGKYGKTIAQILLRYQLERGITVVPKSSNPARIESNFQVFDFCLDEEDSVAIRSLNQEWRSCPNDRYAGHKYYPFQKDYSEN